MKYIIAYDIGSGGLKTVLINTNGEVINYEFFHYELIYPKENFVEQDPTTFLSAMITSTNNLLNKTNIKDEIIAISLSYQMLGIVPVDEKGNHLHNVIIWLDSRAEKQAKKLTRIIPPKLWLYFVGAVPSAKDVIPKLIWIYEHKRDLFDATYKFLGVGGYIINKLTGNFVTDQTDAFVTGLFSLTKFEWINSGFYYQLIKIISRYWGVKYSVLINKLPNVIKSTDVVGYLKPDIAKKLNLPSGIPVIAGCGDGLSCAIGSGAISEGEPHIYIGTSGWIGLHSKKEIYKGNCGIVSIASAQPNMYLLIGECECVGACLDWFKKEILDEKYEVLDKIVEDTEVGSNKLIFNPWLFGERSPIPSSRLRGSFLNLSLSHKVNHILRSIYEGVGFNLRWILDNIERVGFHNATLRAVGGGAKSDTWLQIIADITGKKIEKVHLPQFASAYGAALLSLISLKIYNNFNELKKIIKVEKLFEPNYNNKKIYDELFYYFKQSLNKLHKFYNRLNKE